MSEHRLILCPGENSFTLTCFKYQSTPRCTPFPLFFRDPSYLSLLLFLSLSALLPALPPSSLFHHLPSISLPASLPRSSISSTRSPPPSLCPSPFLPPCLILYLCIRSVIKNNSRQRLAQTIISNSKTNEEKMERYLDQMFSAM